MNAARLAARPLGMLTGTLAGMAAAAAFQRAWSAASGSDHVPAATEQGRGWGEILLAAGLQGAVFALVKAAADRASAQGVQRMTGSWPG